ncbi:MAG: hypothetical protein R8G66_24005 [Cytophagales bacterium]|nr:hypothetical protein [Cytophagales bacterium]
MDKGFTLKETKNCRKYTKHVYELSQRIDESFVQSFSLFGSSEVTNFSQMLPGSYDMIKIRNYEFSFEIAASLNGHDMIVTYQKKDQPIMDMVEVHLKGWIFG